MKLIKNTLITATTFAILYGIATLFVCAFHIKLTYVLGVFSLAIGSVLLTALMEGEG